MGTVHAVFVGVGWLVMTAAVVQNVLSDLESFVVWWRGVKYLVVSKIVGCSSTLMR